MNRRLVIRILSIIVLIISVSFFAAMKARGKGMTEYKTITVEEGDTLWKIVKNNCSNYNDIRECIDYVKKVNNLNSPNIMPGEKIKIPRNL